MKEIKLTLLEVRKYSKALTYLVDVDSKKGYVTFDADEMSGIYMPVIGGIVYDMIFSPEERSWIIETYEALKNA